MIALAAEDHVEPRVQLAQPRSLMAVQAVVTWPAAHVLTDLHVEQVPGVEPVPDTENLPIGQGVQIASAEAVQAVPYVPGPQSSGAHVGQKDSSVPLTEKVPSVQVEH